jgi:hypothetical protein
MSGLVWAGSTDGPVVSTGSTEVGVRPARLGA